MVWSNWQGAIWRGAAVMLLMWTGLAWTQTPTRPVDPAEPTMVVHENGKSTRCRVLETWQLPDGRRAHLLEAIETGEKITIVTEAVGGTPANPRAMSIRIFAWGKGNQAPPEGAPLPPHLRQDSGVLIKNEVAVPAGTMLVDAKGPAIVNSPDDSALGGSYAPLPPRNPLSKLLPRRAGSREDCSQVITFPGEGPLMPAAGLGSNDNKVIPAKEPANPTATPILQVEGAPLPPPPGLIPAGNTNPQTNVVPAAPTAANPGAPATSVVPAVPGAANPGTSPATNIVPAAPVVTNPSTVVHAPIEMYPNSVEVRKTWRPGDRITSWWQSRNAKPEVVKLDVPANPVVVGPAKGDDPKLLKADDPKVKQADQYLTQENKLADKKLADKIEKIYKQPFSTAMNPNQMPSAPEVKKPEPMPLAIPAKPAAKDDKPAAKDDKPAFPPPPMPLAGEAKPAGATQEDKRDMFGTGSVDKVLPPGKSVLENPAVKPGLVKLPAPPTPRMDDPLMSPDKIAMTVKPKIMPPVEREAVAANPWPLGAQSVLAARSGLEGPVMYVPVPTVTVPQPNHPPTPPPPNMPDAPNLNAYVNAFTPPPQPKGAQQMPPQGMMPPPGMMPQQAMGPYGYPMQPNPYQPMPGYPYAMNPNQQPMMPSAGPTANYGRQYMGPMPPPNPFASPVMPAGYGYPPQQPMQPQQPVQQAGYASPAPAGVTQQIDQLVKVMRENPYPAQREWAGQMLASYEWRVHPQIIPALLQSASQDPAASVRAGCINCLGRMQCAVEPVMATLHAMRSDIDPRVRGEVEQAFIRLGQTPTAPQ